MAHEGLLISIYTRWLRHTGWPAMSADELLFEIAHHREEAVGDRHARMSGDMRWLDRFSRLWERAAR